MDIYMQLYIFLLALQLEKKINLPKGVCIVMFELTLSTFSVEIFFLITDT